MVLASTRRMRLSLLVILHLERLGQRVGAPRRATRSVRPRREVFLHQHGRDGQDVADVVEALAGIVGGEVLFGAELDAQQVANGVGVLVAVQAVRHYAAGIGLGIAVERSNSPWTYLTSVSISASDRGMPLGGISPLRTFSRIRSQPSR